MNIRVATQQDRGDIERVHWSAFPEGERELVAKLAIDLLAEDTTPPTVSLLAEADGAVVGHVAFSPVAIADHAGCQAYILAPLAVQADLQKRRIGSTLVEHGMRQLAAAGAHVVFVYGDPEYYGRFGFTADAARNYTTPYPLQYPFGWQAVILNACGIGDDPAVITCVGALCHPELW